MEDFLEFAAEVLGVQKGTLTPETEYGSLPEWDSVMHFRLVMETEARYGTSIPLAAVPQLRKLTEFAPYINPKDKS